MMPKYMIVGNADNETFSLFAEDYNTAKRKMMDLECGLGGYAELYVREGSEYTFLEA